MTVAAEVPRIYTDDFFDWYQEDLLSSARVVAPLVKALVQTSSVIDVGCGRGAWLRGFQECGVDRIQGVDGPYVPLERLLIPKGSFTSANLNVPFQLEGSYDLAVCLEVAEHLAPDMAPILVRQLSKVAPVVLFSAAVPGQGGNGHVNEQLPSYWRRHFAEQGFQMFDPIRPLVFKDRRVAWWYRQNLLLYVKDEAASRFPALADHRVPEDDSGLEWLHISMNNQPTVRQAFGDLSKAVQRSLAFRTGKLRSLLR